MRRCLIAAWMLGSALSASAATQVVVVSGLGGEPQYEERFGKWSEQVAKASASVTTGDPAQVKRLSGDQARRENIEAALRAAAQSAHAGDHFVLVLLGHGSFDGTDYRFNIPGEDITGAGLKALLDRFPEGVIQLVVDATSSSGAMADLLASPRRLVIAATKSGERNASRFGGYWAEALNSSDADKDKDGSISVQEAYDYANRKVGESFKSDASIATEHARIVGDDAGRFVVSRLGTAALFANDTQLAAMRTQQDGIEQRIDLLRTQKTTLAEDDYYGKLEPVLLEMARLGQRIDARLAQLGMPAGVGNGKP
ncbi:MAG: hypothetical protein WDO12_05460 [Pseudomonadota bacterium]